MAIDYLKVAIRAGEPELVGAGCFWLLGAGATWKKSRAGAGATKN